jgi:hypothetical protein
MKLLYPRCCVLDVQPQQVMACLRRQEVDGPAHKEVRTFGSDISDAAVLSNWLAGHGVTHVAIGHSTGPWKPLSQALQQAFTVLLIDPVHATDIKDVQWTADLLAYGLVQGQEVMSWAVQEATPTSRRPPLTLVVVLFTVLLVIYGVWNIGGRVDPHPAPTPAPLPSVRWQHLQMNYQHTAGEPFTLPLPALERIPENVPVDIRLEPSMVTANWLQLDRDRLQVHGTAPITAAGQTYQLSVRAQAEHGSESRLQITLTITGQPHPPLSAADSPPPPPLPPPRLESPDRPLDTSGTMKIWHFW